MEISRIDPRTTTWQLTTPSYHVYFWTKGVGALGIPPDHVAAWSSEFEIRGAADVREVIDWAEQEAANERTYTLYALVDRAGERGLVHLLGTDPNRRA